MTPSSDNDPSSPAAGDFATEAEAAEAAAPLDDSVSAALRPDVGEAGLASTGAAIGGGQAPQVGPDKDDLRDRPAGQDGSGDVEGG